MSCPSSRSFLRILQHYTRFTLPFLFRGERVRLCSGVALLRQFRKEEKERAHNYIIRRFFLCRAAAALTLFYSSLSLSNFSAITLFQNTDHKKWHEKLVLISPPRREGKKDFQVWHEWKESPSLLANFLSLFEIQFKWLRPMQKRELMMMHH